MNLMMLQEFISVSEFHLHIYNNYYSQFFFYHIVILSTCDRLKLEHQIN